MADHGTYRAYVERRFRQSTLDLIGKINEVIAEYEPQGFSLTVRQMHYQFVSRGWLPNSDKTYKSIQGAISDGRLAGLISWTAIEDRGRNLMGLNHVSGPGEAVAQAARNFRLDLWSDQEWRPEVWVEKQALEGVIGSICNELRVDFYACKGYNSQSMQWEAGQRFATRVHRGQRPIVFHLGDHDPSGLDMTRDNRERLALFAGVPVYVQRLALNLDQIDRYDPPPNYAKTTDSRIEDYKAMMDAAGRDHTESWELDALDPRTIRNLIKDAVGRLRDEAKWEARLAQEVADREALEDVIDMMGGGGGDG